MDHASLRSPELMPTQDSERKLSMADYTILWAGMTINIVAFSLGAQYYNDGNGLSAWALTAVVLLGYGLVTLLTAMVGDIGTKYGIPFVAYIRAPFGYKGSFVASFLRAIPGLYWFGFLTWVGAGALNSIMSLLFGVENLTVMIIVFAVIQIINTMYGLEAMAKFDWIAIPSLAIMFTAILINSLNYAGISISDILAIQTGGEMSFVHAVTGIAGGWITMALNGSDLTRQIKRPEGYENMGFWKRNKKAIVGQFLGLMLVGVLTMLVGMAAGIATGEWDLNSVVALLFSNKVILILCYLCILFAQWSTNTSANLMPPAMSLLNIFPKLNFKWSAVICGVIAVAIQPWRIQSSGTFLVDVQVWISNLLGPVMGILLIDYFVIRKTKVNIHDLFTSGGQYQYMGGVNPAAIISLVGGFGLGLLFKDFAFFAGFGCSMIIYFVLMKCWILKKYEQNINKEKLFTA